MIEVFYVWTMIMLKISLALFFFRLMKDKRERRILWIVVGASSVFGFAYFWFAVFQCGVPGKGKEFWYKKITEQCVSNVSALAMAYTHALIQAGTDILLVSLPIPMVRKAKINRREKNVVIGILLLATV
jgi:hypothetical protein